MKPARCVSCAAPRSEDSRACVGCGLDLCPRCASDARELRMGLCPGCSDVYAAEQADIAVEEKADAEGMRLDRLERTHWNK